MQQKTLLQPPTLGVDLSSNESTSSDKTVISAVRLTGKTAEVIVLDDKHTGGFIYTTNPHQLYSDPVVLRMYREMRQSGIRAKDAKRTLELMGYKANEQHNPWANWDGDGTWSGSTPKPKMPYYHGKRRF